MFCFSAFCCFLLLHELVFFGCHSQFASYKHSIASYSHSCKILQPHVAAMILMHSNEVFAFIGASRMKNNQQIVVKGVRRKTSEKRSNAYAEKLQKKDRMRTQKNFDSIIFCVLCCMNWYSWGIISTSLRIRTHSLCIRTVVKFHNQTLRLQYGCIAMRYYPPRMLL